MTQFLDIHLATDDERCRAHENCHDVWSLGLTLTEHVARREKSALHRRAHWIVGCLGGKVVAALASHPVRFWLHGRSFPGIGIASVHTLDAYRGQGIAPRMIRWAESHEQQAGARISTLFCDIDPRYYERLGYTLCPAHIGWASTDSANPGVNAVAGWRLVAVPAGEEFARRVPRLASLYDSDHGQRPLAVDRTADYWEHLAARQPTAEHFWLLDPTGQTVGYAWLRQAKLDLLIDDQAVLAGDAERREKLFRLVIEMAKGRALTRAGGWMPKASPAEALFAISRREDEITMVKSLDMSLSFDGAAIESADWWQEIDHV